MAVVWLGVCKCFEGICCNFHHRHLITDLAMLTKYNVASAVFLPFRGKLIGIGSVCEQNEANADFLR